VVAARRPSAQPVPHLSSDDWAGDSRRGVDHEPQPSPRSCLPTVRLPRRERRTARTSLPSAHRRRQTRLLELRRRHAQPRQEAHHHAPRRIPTRKAALAALSHVLECERAGVWLDDKQTVADYLTGWLADKTLTLKPTTIANYTAYLTNDLIPALGCVRLEKLPEDSAPTSPPAELPPQPIAPSRSTSPASAAPAARPALRTA
jgi:hypothetical protein